MFQLMPGVLKMKLENFLPDLRSTTSLGLEEVRDEVQILPYGQISPKGKISFLVDEESVKLILAAFQKSNTDLVIDYEHRSLSGSEAPTAGWIKELVDKGKDGLWAKVQWTDRAKEYLQKREYRYISPVVLVRKRDGRAVELLGAALTNLPAIDGMAPVVNQKEEYDFNKLLDINNKFKELVVMNEGPSKHSSGVLTIVMPTLTNDNKWYVGFGGYDIGDWPRNCEWGPFNGFKDMLDFLECKIKEAELITRNEFDY